MDFISFKVIEGTEKAREIEQWRAAIDPKLALVDIEYLPKATTPNQHMMPMMKLTVQGYKSQWYHEEEFYKILINYVKINWSGLKK